MTGSQRDAEASRGRAAAVVWNVVVPALGLALILGAPILPALVIAAAASVVLQALDSHHGVHRTQPASKRRCSSKAVVADRSRLRP